MLSFYGEMLLALVQPPWWRSTPHLGYPLCGCLCSIFTATLQNWRPYLLSATGWRAMLWCKRRTWYGKMGY